MKLKLFNKTLIEYFDHYVLKLSIDDFKVTDNELKMIRINKDNLSEVGNAAGNTTGRWIKEDYPFAEGYCFYNSLDEQIGSCWVMYKGGDEKLYRIRNTDSFIFRLEVNEQHRGKGYSKMIMKDMITAIKKRDCKDVTLVCAVKNSVALSLYQNLGMKIVDRKRFFRIGNVNVPYHAL